MGEQEVLAMTELLRRHFAAVSEDTEDIDITREAVDDALEAVKVFEEGGDIGVQTFWPKSKEEMWKLLDFPEGRPVLWNKYRTKDTALTAWDKGETETTRHEYNEGSDRMNAQPISLFPHQLHAIAACVETIFDERRKTDKGGMLIADGVGLGKISHIVWHPGVSCTGSRMASGPRRSSHE